MKYLKGKELYKMKLNMSLDKIYRTMKKITNINTKERYYFKYFEMKMHFILLFISSKDIKNP